MGFTIGGWSETEDPASVFVGQKAMDDEHLHTDGDSIIVPAMNNIIGVAHIGTTFAVRNRLVSPSLRRINSLEVSPVEDAVAPADGFNVMLHPRSPIPLTINEELSSEWNADTTGGQSETIVFLADGAIAPVEGEIHHIHFTISVTTIIDIWTLAALTLSDDLPIRDFDIVGGVLIGADNVAFRIVVPGNPWRPGAICQAAVDAPNHPLFRNGGLGVWARFNPVTLPKIQICTSSAGATGTLNGVLDVIPR